MDWKSIESSLLTQTESYCSVGQDFSMKEKENLPLPPPASLSKFADNEAGEFGLNYALRELKTLREYCNRQEEKISVLEKLLVSHGTLSETMNNGIIDRIVKLEKLFEPKSIVSVETEKHHFIKDKYDTMICDRLCNLEDITASLQERLGDEDVVGHLGKIVNSSLDHIKAFGAIMEKTKNKSDQAVVLLDALFQAFASLQQGGQGEEEISFVDFAHFSSMDENHQQRIKHIIMDSFQRMIDKSIRAQLGAAIECLNDLFNPQLRGVENDLRCKLENVELNMKMAFEAVYERLEHDEKRISDKDSKLFQVERKVEEIVASAKAHTESVSNFREDVCSIRSDLKSQKDNLDMFIEKRGILGTGGLAKDREYVALRNDLQSLQDALNKTEEQHNSTCGDVEDVRFKLTQFIEKRNQRERELEDRIGNTRDSARDDTTKLKAQVQMIIEQQVGELTRKFNKLEGKFDKYDTKNTAQNNDTFTPGMMALKKTSKELTEGLEGVRQNIANVTFDLDDLRQAFKDLEKKNVTHASEKVSGVTNDETKLRVNRIEDSVASLREAMDALQDEIVMLAQPSSDTGISEGKVNFCMNNNHGTDENSGVTSNKPKIPIGTKTEASPKRANQQPIEELRAGDVVEENRNSENNFKHSPVSCVEGNMNLSSMPPAEKASVSIDLSSTDSSFSASSDENSDEEDIVGINPKITNSQSETPSPSDVLTEQLRIKADFEREEALRRVQSKGKVATPDKVAGPPISAAEAKTDSASSTEPIVSGSLLGGGGRRSKSSGALPSSSVYGDAPLFQTWVTHASDSRSDGVAFEQSKSSTSSVTVPKDHIPGEGVYRKDTIQCSYCLRRIPKTNVTSHSKSCELRTELCPNGCGAKILAIKMEKHLIACRK